MERLRDLVGRVPARWRYVLCAVLGAVVGALVFAIASRPSSATCPSANRRLLRLDCWDWGDAATWATGLLTAVLVAAAVWQLADARQQAIWKQARAVPVTLSEKYPDGLDGDVIYKMTVHNLSDLPIFGVSPMYTSVDTWDSMMETPGDDRNLMPGETFKLRKKLPRLNFLGVSFADASHRVWVVTVLLSHEHPRLVPYEVFVRLVARHDAEVREKQKENKRLRSLPGY